MGRRKEKKSKEKIITAQPPPEEPEELTRAPHSFVIHRGSVGKHIMQLMKDFRKIMEPFTASSLKVKKKNSIKDFVSISTLLHVSHMTVFTITEVSPYMRLARLPQGPTLTFKIHDYCLSRDVASSLRKQYTHSKCFLNSPLVIMNGFSCEGPQLRLMSTMFQSMFPTLNVAKLKLNDIKRCVLLNYNEETKCIDFRHYVIRVTPTGLNRGVKKLVLGKVPNLAKYKDVSDFVYKDELLSDMSEPEDEDSQVVLPQKMFSKGNHANNTSAIRLTELGPRMTLQLVKVEGGLMDGEVIFHEYVHKSEEEVEDVKKQRRIKRRLKETRRREQEMNVLKKEEAKAINKEKSLEGMKRKQREDEENKSQEMIELKKENSTTRLSQEEPATTVKINNFVEAPTSNNNHDDSDDDAEWYRKEVGQEPDPDLFSFNNKPMKRRGGPFGRRGSFKKPRFDSNRSEFDRGGRGGGFRGRGTKIRLGTGRGRFQGARGGFKSRAGFSNRDDYTERNNSQRPNFGGNQNRGGFRGGFRGQRGNDRRGRGRGRGRR